MLDSFLRKHAPGPEAFVRRKPPPLSSLETPKAQDDAKLLQLMGGRADGVRLSPSAAPGSFGGAGYGGYAGSAPPEARPGPMGYGLPVARRGPERPRLGAGRGAGRRGTGGRGKARTNIVEERAKDDVHEENLQLRRVQMEMKTKLQKLQVQIRQAQEPKDAKAFEQKASELGEMQQMQRALSAAASRAKATSPSPSGSQRRGLRARQLQGRPHVAGATRAAGAPCAASFCEPFKAWQPGGTTFAKGRIKDVIAEDPRKAASALATSVLRSEGAASCADHLDGTQESAGSDGPVGSSGGS